MEKKDLRRTAVIFAIVFSAAGMWKMLRASEGERLYLLFLGIGGYSALSAIFYPYAIGPVYIGLRTAFRLLMEVTTRLALGFVFYFVLTPTGILFRIFGRDLLNIKIKSGEKTYWVPREKKTLDPKRYENQF